MSNVLDERVPLGNYVERIYYPLDALYEQFGGAQDSTRLRAHASGLGNLADAVGDRFQFTLTLRELIELENRRRMDEPEILPGYWRDLLLERLRRFDYSFFAGFRKEVVHPKEKAAALFKRQWILAAEKKGANDSPLTFMQQLKQAPVVPDWLLESVLRMAHGRRLTITAVDVQNAPADYSITVGYAWLDYLTMLDHYGQASLQPPGQKKIRRARNDWFDNTIAAASCFSHAFITDDTGARTRINDAWELGVFPVRGLGLDELLTNRLMA